jgi:putative transposase
MSPWHRDRRSLRWAEYDYTQAGVYSVTLCVKDRQCLFGDVVGEEMRLSAFGRIALDCWNEIPRHIPAVVLDEFVVMPNHMHGIVVITDPDTDGGVMGGFGGFVGGMHASPLHDNRYRLRSRSLGSIVGSYKSAVTKRINTARQTPGAPVWQREYYDRVVRDDREMDRIRRYIRNNPSAWAKDRLNPR